LHNLAVDLDFVGVYPTAGLRFPRIQDDAAGGGR